MQWKNNDARYGLVSVSLHWLVALTVFSLFALGYYMTGLDYYHRWYQSAPNLHRSIGLTLFAVMLLRVAWRLLTPTPAPLASHKRWEKRAAKIVHLLLYLLIFTAMISGYLISTADGSAIRVFDWFSVPSLTGRQPGLEDIAGEVHYWATGTLISLAILHALAAIKHHMIDRDNTLKRMLGIKPRHTPPQQGA